MNPSYFAGWILFRLVFSTYFRWRVCNPERVPRHGPVIIASNHASFLDPPLIGAGLPRAVNFLARDTLFRWPGVAAVLRSWNVVPVDRDGGGATGLRQIFDRLMDDGAIVLFPEGTRTLSGCLRPARSGVGLVVIKSEAPVIPVRVFGTFEAMGRHLRFPRPNRVIVKYGKPLWFAQLRARTKACSKAEAKAIYQQVAEEIMSAIAALQPSHDKEAFP